MIRPGDDLVDRHEFQRTLEAEGLARDAVDFEIRRSDNRYNVLYHDLRGPVPSASFASESEAFEYVLDVLRREGPKERAGCIGTAGRMLALPFIWIREALRNDGRA